MPLDSNNKYRVMSRAFALGDQGGSRFDRPFEFRAPMQEPASKLFTDSLMSEPFGSKPPLINRVTSRTSSLWFVAPITVIFILILLVGMLIIYFLKVSSTQLKQNLTSITFSVAESQCPDLSVCKMEALECNVDMVLLQKLRWVRISPK